jgi:hypothetical protein
MIRSFCIGAFVGYLFGSSKAGVETRNQLNGFFNELLKSDRAEGIEDYSGGDFEHGGRFFSENGDVTKQELAIPGRSGGPRRAGSASSVADVPERAAKPKQSGASAVADTAPVKAKRNEKVPERSAANREEPKAKEDDATKSGEAGISPNQAHELADKLSAKPSPPPHEEQEPS